MRARFRRSARATDQRSQQQRLLQAWHDACQRDPVRVLSINVNMSTRQLPDASFSTTLPTALHDGDLTRTDSCLRSREPAPRRQRRRHQAATHTLKALGAGIAVDDFGTGYSALSRLQVYPVDILKIDQSFIHGIDQDAGKVQLVRGIIDLGASLHMSVVAEGMEQPEQTDQLRDIQSPHGQGYVVSRPIPPDQLHALLKTGDWLLPAPRTTAPTVPGPP